MNVHITKTRNSLASLAVLAQKIEAAERRILAAAEQRLEAIQSQLERARPGMEAAPDMTQTRYLELVAERGQAG